MSFAAAGVGCRIACSWRRTCFSAAFAVRSFVEFGLRGAKPPGTKKEALANQSHLPSVRRLVPVRARKQRIMRIPPPLRARDPIRLAHATPPRPHRERNEKCRGLQRGGGRNGELKSPRGSLSVNTSEVAQRQRWPAGFRVRVLWAVTHSGFRENAGVAVARDRAGDQEPARQHVNVGVSQPHPRDVVTCSSIWSFAPS